MKPGSQPRPGWRGKRLFDVCLCVPILVLVLPLLAVLGAAILATTGRPALFVQLRPGFRGRPFSLVKLRTMRPLGVGEGGDHDGVRLTSLGRRLRSWSLDELPTLWNVIVGDMSLVGPRPLLPEYLERYTPEQARRHEVRPGITGWAQVNGRNELTWEQKFTLDVWYVDHCSFRLDARILWLTVLKVLKREGISAKGQATMPEFMGSRERREDRERRDS